MSRVVLALLCCCLSITVVRAADSTIDDIRAEAAHDPDAEAALALRYFKGTGVAADAAEGLRLMEHAASRGSAAAESRMAQIFEQGLPGIAPPDSAKATRYWKSAAEHGNAQAMSRIGRFYLTGTGGFEKDPGKAFDNFQAAADHGDTYGALLMGYAYLKGHKVARNTRAAMIYFHMAAPDLPEAYDQLGRIFDIGNGVDRDQVRAARFFRKAADGGDARGQTQFARYLWQGLGGLALDRAGAIRYWRMAADKGDADALYELGMVHLGGSQANATDVKTAVSYFRRSAVKGNARAQHCLAALTQTGAGGVKDCEGALNYLTLSADSGFSPARKRPGNSCQRGDCAPPTRESLPPPSPISATPLREVTASKRT